MSQLRQTSFARGELAPGLWGRSDLELFDAGARRLYNFFPSVHGAAVSRPGTEYLTGSFGNGQVRLVPFVYSDTASYVLEFSGGMFAPKIRVFSAGALVATVASPYFGDDPKVIRWVQSGNVLTITCPFHPPRLLARVAHNNWTLTDISFDRPKLFELTGAFPEIDSVTLPVEDVAAGKPAREWQWAITGLKRDSKGVVTESAPQIISMMSNGVGAPVPVPGKVAVYPDKPVTVRFLSIGTVGNDPNLLGFLVYRGKMGRFGLVGATDNVGTYTDIGNDPDFTVQPPQGLNPFKQRDANNNPLPLETPTAVSYFEERLVFGGTNYASGGEPPRPGNLFFSASGDYYNFDERLLPVDDQALLYELAARRREVIRHLLAVNRLLVFTSASVWSFGGAGGPLKPDSVEARVQADIGCTDLPPLSLQNAALWVRTKGRGVCALTYERERDGFTTVDLSYIAQHLFQGSAGKTIVDWCYAEDPWGLVWAVREDGKLLSLTLLQQAQGWVWGWAQHETDGEVLAVCSVPEGDEDAVYMVVKRANVFGSAGYYSLERMTSRVQNDTPNDDVCVDMAFKYQGPTAITKLTGLAAFAGRADVYVIGKDNPPLGPLTVSATGELELPEPPRPNLGSDVVLWVGLLYQPELETLDAAPGSVRGQQKTITAVFLEVDQSQGVMVGQGFDELVLSDERDVADGYGVPSNATAVLRVNPKGAWDNGARACLRQTLPVPITVVGITREVDVGG